MTKEQAINVLEQALNAATLKGVYNMADVQAILNALSLLKQD
jgi:hypothetical protein